MIEVSEAQLDREFGRETVRRAREYAGNGRVRDLDVESTGEAATRVSASVLGTASTPYQVQVRIQPTRRGVEMWSVCSCPVGLRCKHGAATLLVASADSAPAHGWERDLEAALEALETVPSTAQPTPLAVQVELRRTRAAWRGNPSRQLEIRPLQRGRLGRWIKSGIGWSQVRALVHSGDHDHDPAQLAVLAELAAQLDGGYADSANLAFAGPLLWPLLRRLREAGVELVPGHGLATITLAERPVRPGADVHADEHGLALTLGLGSDEHSWDVADVQLLGQPTAHGAALFEPATETTAHLTLAPTARPLAAGVRRLLERPDPIRVGADDVESFRADYLPRLQRHLAATSADGSVELPPLPVPRLVLEIDWFAPDRASGSFAWVYDASGTEHRYALDSGAGFADVRRPEAEAELLHDLQLSETARELLCDGSGRLRPEHTWSDERLLQFATAVLPELEAGPVEIEEHGARPRFREATGEPEISFELGETVRGTTHWLDLEVMVHVDDEHVPLATIVTALTRGKSRIFLTGGTIVRIDNPAFARLAEMVEAASELVGRRPESIRDSIRVARRDVDAWAELDELGVVDQQAAEWVAHARALRDLEKLPEPAEPKLATSLRHYQYDGFRWLAFLQQAGLGGVLADDMGLGKTLQALATIAHAREAGAAPFLVVAPTSVVSTWASEAATHAPHLTARTITATGARREESIAELAAGADLVITSYTLLRLEAEEYAELTWGGLVLDEAQQIKNHRSRGYRAVRQIDAPFRLALTGTPFENRLMELWSLLSVVAPGLYPSPERFREVVVRPVEAGDDLALKRFQRRIRPFLLRRTKEVAAPDLPPKQEQVLRVDLGTRHRRIYDTHLQHERQTLLGLLDDFAEHRIAIFRSLTRLRQLSLDPALVEAGYHDVGSAKLDVLVAHLRELAAEGHRALVFSQFTGYLARVRERLGREGIATCYLDGSTRDRGRVVEQFRGGEATAFLISLKAGGVGLTLTEADYVFVLDPWWNPAAEAQAVDRAHRIGQQRPVMVYRLVSADTIEEKVMALKQRKAELFARVIDGGGAVDSAIGADDVRALLRD